MINFIECSKAGYPARTTENVINSDMTIAFAVDFNSAGERLTKRLCQQNSRLYLPYLIDNRGGISFNGAVVYEHITRILKLKTSLVINIAGNGIYTLKTICADENTWIDALFIPYLQMCSKYIKAEKVISGGQTGADFCGVMAAHKLGIPTTVLAPKGWVFRNKEGKDIADEKLFKARFL